MQIEHMLYMVGEVMPKQCVSPGANNADAGGRMESSLWVLLHLVIIVHLAR